LNASVFLLKEKFFLLHERFYCFFSRFFALSQYKHTASGRRKRLLHLNGQTPAFIIYSILSIISADRGSALHPEFRFPNSAFRIIRAETTKNPRTTVVARGYWLLRSSASHCRFQLLQRFFKGCSRTGKNNTLELLACLSEDVARIKPELRLVDNEVVKLLGGKA